MEVWAVLHWWHPAPPLLFSNDFYKYIDLQSVWTDGVDVLGLAKCQLFWICSILSLSSPKALRLNSNDLKSNDLIPWQMWAHLSHSGDNDTNYNEQSDLPARVVLAFPSSVDQSQASIQVTWSAWTNHRPAHGGQEIFLIRPWLCQHHSVSGDKITVTNITITLSHHLQNIEDSLLVLFLLENERSWRGPFRCPLKEKQWQLSK